MRNKKDRFLEILNSVMLMEDKVSEFEVALGKLTSDYKPMLDVHSNFVSDTLNLLSDYLSEENALEIEEWIGWWIWETDRGKDAERLTATIPELHDGKPFAVKTVEDLWSIVETYLPHRKEGDTMVKCTYGKEGINCHAYLDGFCYNAMTCKVKEK